MACSTNDFESHRTYRIRDYFDRDRHGRRQMVKCAFPFVVGSAVGALLTFALMFSLLTELTLEERASEALQILIHEAKRQNERRDNETS